jgi:hypothetical protein
MLSGLDALSIMRFHDAELFETDWPVRHRPARMPGPWPWIAANHRCNCLLWREEDKARRTDVGATEIAASKRLIDRHNQQRNDAVEAIDEAILSQLAAVVPDADARLSSETAGAMIDRLSILALKIYHMHEQTQRSDASATHLAACSGKWQRLVAQRRDLATCFDQLIEAACNGRAYFKVYRQFKMYNDPALNPYLYGQPDLTPGNSGKAVP